jgi:predicted DNA-binding transcriptional regulator AlpA
MAIATITNTDARARDAEPLLTVPQFGARAGMTERAVFCAINRGSIPVVRLGRRVRIRWSDVERVLKEQRERPLGAVADLASTSIETSAKAE